MQSSSSIRPRLMVETLTVLHSTSLTRWLHPDKPSPMVMAKLRSHSSKWKEENLPREHPMVRKTWMEFPCNSQTSSKMLMAMNRTTKGSRRMARVHLNSKWKK